MKDGHRSEFAMKALGKKLPKATIDNPQPFP